MKLSIYFLLCIFHLKYCFNCAGGRLNPHCPHPLGTPLASAEDDNMIVEILINKSNLYFCNLVLIIVISKSVHKVSSYFLYAKTHFKPKLYLKLKVSKLILTALPPSAIHFV